MSRFLITTLGSLGDLHPYLAVARILVKRGHQAVIATTEDYRAAVKSAGVEFAAVGPSMAELGNYQMLVAKLYDVHRGTEYLVRHLVMPHLRTTYEHLLRASDGADLLVSHPLSVTLPLVAERRKLPWVATVLSPMSFMSCYDPPVIPAAPWLQRLRNFGPMPYRFLFGLFKRSIRSWEGPLMDFRDELGLAPSNRMAMFEGQFSPLLNLALFDPQLAQPQPDWPANSRICGTPIFDGVPPDNCILEDMERFLADGDSPIVFALGSSAVWVAGDFWDNSVAAVRHLGRRAILITGPKVPKSLPDDIRAFPYLPYSRVFPRAAAVVHQAGIGTLAQAMRAGRPQLIVPLAFDQPDNAQRAHTLGVGRVLPFKRATERKLASELALLLARPSYAEVAHTIAEELARTDGAFCAANELIACVRFGQPAWNNFSRNN